MGNLLERHPLDRLKDAARQGLIQTYTDLSRSVPGVVIDQDEKAVVSSGPSHLSFCNFAAGFNYDSLESAVEILERVRRIAPREKPSKIGLLHQPGDRPNWLECLFEGWGFHPRYQLAQLGVAPTLVTQSSGPSLVKAESSEARLKAATFMTDQFFPMGKSEVKRSVIQATKACSHDLYTLSDGHETIAAVMLSDYEEGMGLYNLCVKVGWRRRGLGRHIIAKCQESAAERGKILTLQCGHDLAPWYESCGFIHLGSVVTYHESPAVE